MEIKGSTTYAAATANQAGAAVVSEKSAEQLKTAAPLQSTADSVVISDEAKKLLEADQAAATTADGDPPEWPPTPATRDATAADGDPPPWPPVVET